MVAALPACVRVNQPPTTGGTPDGRTSTAATQGSPTAEPTQRPNSVFEVSGTPFCFQGTNNYYLNFKSRAMVDDVFERARRLGLGVIRMWANIDRGSLDGSVASMDPGPHNDGTKDGYYTQYWDPEARQPAYNDGPKGLEALDYALHAARKASIRVILVLTNNWRDFGGMDQYLTWYGLTKHHQFYTDERVRAAYKNWVYHLASRRNSIDGITYAEDPIIFAWELANEPRIRNFRNFDSPEGWDIQTITRWADEMSRFIHSVDPNHMVAVGDEGQFASGGQGEFYLGRDGVDHLALLNLEGVDFGTFHLYPEHWGRNMRWSYDWLKDHLKAAFAAGKPTVLEEYGLVLQRNASKSSVGTKPSHREDQRLMGYRNWNEIMLQGGGAGSMFWMLAGTLETGEPYPDYDHFTVYEGEESAALIQAYARKFSSQARACLLAPAARGSASPFVRVRKLPKGDEAAEGSNPSATHTAVSWAGPGSN